MRLKTGEIKLAQRQLAAAGFYNGEIDGKRGPLLDKAVESDLNQHAAELVDGWRDWPTARKAVACMQLICAEKDIDSGVIDGLYGPQTESALGQLKILTATGSLPRGFGDIIPIKQNPHAFPMEEAELLDEYYGKPCTAKLVRVQCPWPLRLDWDLKSTVTTIAIHEKLSGSLNNVLRKVYEIYGLEGIKKNGLNRYGGSFNCRKKRGSKAAWSTHAWGIALDWYPSQNKLKWDSDRASLAHPDLDAWWEAWEREGWFSLGRNENRDWMHVQAAKR
ncbi:M15 family peptidase [Desulfobacterota bacterium M19]